MSPFASTWGVEPAEKALDFACDHLPGSFDADYYRGVTVAAPPAAVFRWLCQLRVAPYSYDWIDNRGRRSPRELTPGVEKLEPGQRFVSIFRLAEFEQGSRITLEQRGGLLGHVALTYAVSEREGGESRLVLRIAWGPPRLPL